MQLDLAGGKEGGQRFLPRISVVSTNKIQPPLCSLMIIRTRSKPLFMSNFLYFTRYLHLANIKQLPTHQRASGREEGRRMRINLKLFSLIKKNCEQRPEGNNCNDLQVEI